MMGFRFQDPLWLLLLAAAVGDRLVARPAAAGGGGLFQHRYSENAASDDGPARAAAAALGRRWLGLALVTVALARPQRGKEEFRVRAEGIAIEMCIDRSGSMQAMDFEIDGKPVARLAMVKKVFRQFVHGGDGLPGRPDDLIGLVDFGGFAEAKCPLDARPRRARTTARHREYCPSRSSIPTGNMVNRRSAARRPFHGHRRRPGPGRRSPQGGRRPRARSSSCFPTAPAIPA